MAVPLFDTDTPLAPLRASILAKVAEVIERGVYILGAEVEAFERELASYLGVRHVVGVANGTDAITIALRALGVGPGDEVVVPSFTFYATAEAVVNAGARPVFCDVDAQTRNVTPDTVREALSSRAGVASVGASSRSASCPKAIVAVDLFGCPAPIPELRALGLPVLEDAAQAAGASLGGRRAGALGDAATFSFYPSKNLGCFGDGGAIATDRDEVAALARALRFHGSRGSDKRLFDHIGYNSRLDELQAGVLRVLLPELDGWCEGRRQGARSYESAGLGRHVTVPAFPAGADPAWHLYVVLHPQVEHLAAGLAQRGVQVRGYYRTPLHRQPAMAPYAGGGPALPVTDELAATNLALPMSPVLRASQAEEVVHAIAAASKR